MINYDSALTHCIPYNHSEGSQALLNTNSLNLCRGDKCGSFSVSTARGKRMRENETSQQIPAETVHTHTAALPY